MAQSSQVLSTLHRSGNVHDSNGAREFMLSCIDKARAAVGPSVIIEARMDAAFFSDEIVQMLKQADVCYTISAPFERFADLREIVEDQVPWQDNGEVSQYCDAFERQWSPKACS